MSMKDKIYWIVSQHKKTNHLYDNYIPYEYHLRMTVGVCDRFKNLLERQWSEVELACWGHDLIEDTRVTYNDVKAMLGEYVADIIYAVTNEKGKNRAARANGKYYDGIIATEGAAFVKLCDRIANVEYSKMTGSKMFEIYKKENPSFRYMLRDESDYLDNMFDYLAQLFL